MRLTQTYMIAIVTLNAGVSDADLKKAVEDQDYKVTGIE